MKLLTDISPLLFGMKPVLLGKDDIKGKCTDEESIRTTYKKPSRTLKRRLETRNLKAE